MGCCPVFAQWFSTDIEAIASALVADENGVFAGKHVVQPNRRRLGVGTVKGSQVARRGDTAIALHDLREAGFSPVGHGSVVDPMLVDGRGKSVRVAWSNNAADKRIVDDLIAYLLSL